MEILLGVLLVASLIVIAVRKFSAMANVTSHAIAIALMKRNPRRAYRFADRLDIPIERREAVAADEARQLIQKLAHCSSVKAFTVRHTQLLDDNRVLMFTSVKYSDLEVMPGRHGMVSYDVKRTAFHEFLIQYNPATATFLINSDLFTTTHERLHKNEFTRSITSLLTPARA